MRRRSILSTVKKLGKGVFTTHEAAFISGKSLSATTQSLSNLAAEGILSKIYRGIWAQTTQAPSAYQAIPYLFPKHRCYVSFISALHLHGIIGQIPQTITLASTAHARTIRTNLGTFKIHHISPLFFAGFGWYKGSGSFLIAEPEKALVDSLYLSAYKKKHFGHFPELNFARSFSFRKAKDWVNKIPSPKARQYVAGRMKDIGKSLPS